MDNKTTPEEPEKPEESEDKFMRFVAVFVCIGWILIATFFLSMCMNGTA